MDALFLPTFLFSLSLFPAPALIARASLTETNQKQWERTVMFNRHSTRLCERMNYVAHKLITVTLKNIYGCYRY